MILLLIANVVFGTSSCELWICDVVFVGKIIYCNLFVRVHLKVLTGTDRRFLLERISSEPFFCLFSTE